MSASSQQKTRGGHGYRNITRATYALFLLVLSLTLFSDSVFLCHIRANTFCATQWVPSSYSGGDFNDLLKSLENVSDLVRAQSLFFNYLPPLPKSDYAGFIFTFKALIKYNRWLNSFASKLTHNKNTVFFHFFSIKIPRMH